MFNRIRERHKLGDGIISGQNFMLSLNAISLAIDPNDLARFTFVVR